MRKLHGAVAHGLALWLAGAALAHLWFAGFGFPEPLRLAAFHLMAFVPPVFLINKARASSPDDRPSAFDWIFAVASFVPSLWVFLQADAIYERSTYIDPIGPLEATLATVMVLAIIEGVRRAISYTMAGLVVAVIAYLFVCHLMPGLWFYRRLPYGHVVDMLYLSVGSGLYGQLTGISATIVASFLVFGAFLQATGMGRLFSGFGAIVAGRQVGGPAKVAVITSGLFGTVSGSSVANVVVTGAMSIPLMKRLGFRPTLAAGIEAASSVGGAIMPPVMGAAAFVMSETIAVPYSEIIKAAALGAVLYYFAILATVHFESKRLGIRPMRRDEIPTARAILADAHLVLPLALLVGLMVLRFSPYFAAFWSTLAMIAVSWARAHTRMGPAAIFRALVDAGRTISTLAVAVTAAGLIMVALTNTGLLLAFTGIIKSTAGGSLVLLVILLAFVCLFIGVGIPTTPSYIITAAIGAPLLAEYGVPILAIHLFVFYFAVLADASPPVAPAADAAAAIARANPLISGLHAFRLTIGGFAAGFAFIWEPALILNGTLFEIVAVTVAIGGGLVLIASGMAGFASAPLAPWMRVLLIGGGGFVALGHIVSTPLRALVAVVAVGALWLEGRRRASRDAIQPALTTEVAPGE